MYCTSATVLHSVASTYNGADSWSGKLASHAAAGTLECCTEVQLLVAAVAQWRRCIRGSSATVEPQGRERARGALRTGGRGLACPNSVIAWGVWSREYTGALEHWRCGRWSRPNETHRRPTPHGQLQSPAFCSTLQVGLLNKHPIPTPTAPVLVSIRCSAVPSTHHSTKTDFLCSSL